MALSKEIMALLAKGMDRRRLSRVYDGMPKITCTGMDLLRASAEKWLLVQGAEKKATAVIKMLTAHHKRTN